MTTIRKEFKKQIHNQFKYCKIYNKVAAHEHCIKTCKKKRTEKAIDDEII